MKSKKRFWIITAAVVTLITVASVSIAVAADINKSNPEPKEVVYLAEGTVKELALNHAGLTEEDVTELRVVLDYDDRKAEYEVNFRKDNVKYEYEIDAVDGTILSYDAESKKVLQSDTPAYSTPEATKEVAPVTTPSAVPSTPTYITQDEAKNIAIQHAGLQTADVTFTKVKLDYDDGRAEYEVDFYTDSTKYDYELDAVTGKILSIDTESRKNTVNKPVSSPTATPTYITQDAAKKIALEHAGLTEAEVTRVKIELDYDDGRAEYEVDFQVGRVEYEYEIHAATGKIIYFEKDIDD